MNLTYKRVLSIVLAVFLIFGSFSGAVCAQETNRSVEEYNQADQISADNRSPATMTFDLFLMRPFSLLAMALGSVTFVVASPFIAATSGNLKPAYQNLVVAPAKFTFKRKLGDF